MSRYPGYHAIPCPWHDLLAVKTRVVSRALGTETVDDASTRYEVVEVEVEVETLITTLPIVGS